MAGFEVTTSLVDDEVHVIDFLDSGGLRAPLSADLDLRSRGGSLRLRDPSPHVLQVLEVTDLVDHFDARGSLDDRHG